jgi:hypothetical protein
MSERSSASRRASQTRSSPGSNRYIRGEDVSAAVMGVDRLDVNEVDEATHTGLERGEHPGEDPPGGGKGGCGFGIAMSAFPLEADLSPCPGDVGFVPGAEVSCGQGRQVPVHVPLLFCEVPDAILVRGRWILLEGRDALDIRRRTDRPGSELETAPELPRGRVQFPRPIGRKAFAELIAHRRLPRRKCSRRADIRR